MKTYIFGESLKNQRIDLHVRVMNRVFSSISDKKFGIKLCDREKRAHCDAYIIGSDCGILECKTDYYANSGKLLIELISFVLVKDSPEIGKACRGYKRDKIVIGTGSENFDQVIFFIRDCIHGKKKSNLGLGLLPEIPRKHYLSYLFIDKNTYFHYFFKTRDLVNYVKNHFEYYPFSITRSKHGNRLWYTISSLLLRKELERLDIMKYKHGGNI